MSNFWGAVQKRHSLLFLFSAGYYLATDVKIETTALSDLFRTLRVFADVVSVLVNVNVPAGMYTGKS